MGIPLDKMVNMFKKSAGAKKDTDVPVRVSVFVDSTASPLVIDAVRGAFVPQTTNAIVRVERIGDGPVSVKTDTDISLVLSCGSERLHSAVQEIVIAGAPTVVLAESSLEVPFIERDTPMLGLVAATDKNYLLEMLARWILDRTEKDMAFAMNFPFMRDAASNRVVINTAMTNLVTGAIDFIPGADLPVMTLAQLAMLAQLALVHGKELKLERGYEVAGVVASGIVLRAVTRRLVRPAGHLGFVVKGIMGGFGTYAMGRALVELYESDLDYSQANEIVGSVFKQGRDIVQLVAQNLGGSTAATEQAA